MGCLNGWSKPFYLQYDELFMTAVPGTEINFKALTFAIQATDGIDFQVLVVDVVTNNTADRLSNLLNEILEQLKDKHLLPKLLGIISDGNAMNDATILEEFEDIPRLWDLNHLRKVQARNITDIILKRAYAYTFTAQGLNEEFNAFITENNAKNSVWRQMNANELNSLKEMARRFFAVSNLTTFCPFSAGTDTLELAGFKWKTGLEAGITKWLEAGNDPRIFIRYGTVFYPTAVGVFGLFECRRGATL